MLTIVSLKWLQYFIMHTAFLDKNAFLNNFQNNIMEKMTLSNYFTYK